MDYNSEQLSLILSSLRFNEGENEVVEFKKAESNFDTDKIGRYFSALSNEANLKKRSYAWLIFGVDDNKRVTGSSYRANGTELNNLKYEMYRDTSPNISFLHIHTLDTADGRVVMMQIPPAPDGMPVAWKTYHYGREGESLVGLGIEKIERIRKQALEQQFEKLTAYSANNEDEIINLLDFTPIRKAFPNLQNLPDDQIISFCINNNIVKVDANNYSITNLGAILLAKDIGKFETITSIAVRLFKYKGVNRNEIDLKQSGTKGYALGFEGLIREIKRHIEREEITGSVRRKIFMIPELTLREIIINAMIHQDFTNSNKGPLIEVFSDRVEIINSGKPLVEINRMIDSPAKSRNTLLSSLMNKLGLCEEVGSGIDRALAEIEKEALPPIRFEVYENDFTKVTIQFKQSLRQMSREDRILCCYQHACLMKLSNTFMTNASLRRRLDIPSSNYPLASSIISDSIAAGLVKPATQSLEGRRDSNYLPYWA